jgi:hypothetical protein
MHDVVTESAFRVGPPGLRVTLEMFEQTALDRGGVSAITPGRVFEGLPRAVTCEAVKAETELTVEHVTFASGIFKGEEWSDGYFVQEFSDRKQTKLAIATVKELWKIYKSRHTPDTTEFREREAAYRAWSGLNKPTERRPSDPAPASGRAAPAAAAVGREEAPPKPKRSRNEPVAEVSSSRKKECKRILRLSLASVPVFMSELRDAQSRGESELTIVRKWRDVFDDMRLARDLLQELHPEAFV